MSIDVQVSEANLLFKALTFAAYRHRHQFRKGTKPVPYINHSIAVADLLANVGTVSDTETIVAEVSRLLSDSYAYSQMTRSQNPYGDGQAAKRIVQQLLVLGMKSYVLPVRRVVECFPHEGHHVLPVDVEKNLQKASHRVEEFGRLRECIAGARLLHAKLGEPRDQMQVAYPARTLFHIGLGMIRRILIFFVARACQLAEAAGQLMAVFTQNPRQAAFELCMNGTVASEKTPVQEVDAEIDACVAQI